MDPRLDERNTHSVGFSFLYSSLNDFPSHSFQCAFAFVTHTKKHKNIITNVCLSACEFLCAYRILFWFFMRLTEFSTSEFSACAIFVCMWLWATWFYVQKCVQIRQATNNEENTANWKAVKIKHSPNFKTKQNNQKNTVSSDFNMCMSMVFLLVNTKIVEQFNKSMHENLFIIIFVERKTFCLLFSSHNVRAII